MNRIVTTVIDKDTCTGCSMCINVCPSSTISIKDGKAAVTGSQSLGCGHCAAVCPVGAVKVRSLENNALSFASFSEYPAWLPFGGFDTALLVQLMRSRRSCRNYQNRDVDRSMLEDLVKIGITAPSGTNSQKWTFTILPKQENVRSLARQIGNYFRYINRLAEQKYIRKVCSLMGKKELETYFQEYYESVKEALEEYDNYGKDRLFHGATAAIIVASKPGASCPAEDALLATQNILLGAHAMGLGSCLIGFAVEVLKRDRKIKRFAGIPEQETVHSVIALGYPDETYERLPGRKEFNMRYFTNKEN